ncbi:MAG: hypothetical protein R2849_09170 [Thermomicrobiales bacterium]
MEHPVSALLDARVMSGCQTAGADSPCPVDERLELHLAVAFEAGIRCAAARVFIDEIVDDRLFELALEIDRVERHADAVSRHPRIFKGFRGAARVRILFALGRRVEAHVDSDDAIAALPQQQGSDRRVDPAAHGDDRQAPVAVSRTNVIALEKCAGRLGIEQRNI